MLKTKVSGYLFSSTNYSIKEVMNGKDTLTLTIPTESEDSQQIIPELEVIELKHSNSEFVVKSINGDDDELEVTMDLNLDDFNSKLFIGFSKTGGPFDILNTVVPDGWTVEDHFGSTESKTVELEAPTAEEVADSVVNVFGAVIRYDFKTHTQHVYNPSAMVSNGEYVTKELNLVSLSRYQSSSGLVNRLYFYGKEGLSFEDINDGKPYVEDTSYLKGKVKCKYMKDERFTDKQSMLEYAKSQLKTMSSPVSSYECVPNDIGSVDVKYQFLKLDLMSVVTLMDVDRNVRVDHQVVEREIHPYDKTQNTLTLSTSTPTLTGTTSYVSEQISNPNSEFHQQIQTDMDRIAEDILKGSNGHVVINYGDDGKRAEILIMDTDDKETAKDVMRLSKEGIAFSVSGYNGPFTGAIALSGEWFAQFIATWKLTANIIVAGRLQDKSGKSYWDLDKSTINLIGKFITSGLYGELQITDGELKMLDVDGKERVKLFRLDKYYGGQIRFLGDQYYSILTSDGIGIYKSKIPGQISEGDTVVFNAGYLGDATVLSTLRVGGGVYASADSSVTGNFTVSKSLSVSKDLNVSGTAIASTVNCQQALNCGRLSVTQDKIAVGVYGSDLTRAAWSEITLQNGQRVTVLQRV